MFNNKLLITLSLLLSCVFTAHCQEEEFTSAPTGRGKYALVLYMSGGAGYFASHQGAPAYLNPTVSKVNPVYTVRLMWHPDHLIKMGLETGYLTFYSYTLTDSAGKKGKVSFNATPVLLEWSMSLTKHLNIFAGTGAYFLNTQLDYGVKSSARKFAVGWMAAASYIFPISKSSGLGTEFKWLYASGSSNGSFGLQVQYVWKFLNW